MITFEGYERRIDKINAVLKENGIASLEEAKDICTKHGVDGIKSSAVFNLLLLITPFGLTPSARRLL